MQALQTLLFITAMAPLSWGELRLFDGLSGQWQALKLPPLEGCPVCGEVAPMQALHVTDEQWIDQPGRNIHNMGNQFVHTVVEARRRVVGPRTRWRCRSFGRRADVCLRGEPVS